jgi:hypothetical protein
VDPEPVRLALSVAEVLSVSREEAEEDPVVETLRVAAIERVAHADFEADFEM